MGSLTHEPNGNNENFADLTKIRGIGVVRKRWLNSLGIHTIADLAQASVDELIAQAKQEGRSLSQEELTDWITQAQAYFDEALLEPETSPDNADLIELVSDSESPSEQFAEVSVNTMLNQRPPASGSPLPPLESIARPAEWLGGLSAGLLCAT